jgi:DNA-binding IclR family transcriptional regulator
MALRSSQGQHLPSIANSSTARKTQGVNAVERALSILDAFIGDGSRGLAELAKVTGLAKPTALRSLISLEKAGYIVRLNDGRYQLGAKTMQLGTTYQANFRLDQHVLPVLKWLTEQTLESAAFHIREKNSRLCLFRVDSPQLVRDVSHHATLVPLDMTSTGQVLANSTWPNNAERTPVYASSGIFDVLTASMSTAVFGMDRALAGALTVSGPVERFGRSNTKEIALALVRAAHRLSSILGAPMPLGIGDPAIICL